MNRPGGVEAVFVRPEGPDGRGLLAPGVGRRAIDVLAQKHLEQTVPGRGTFVMATLRYLAPRWPQRPAPVPLGCVAIGLLDSQSAWIVSDFGSEMGAAGRWHVRSDAFRQGHRNQMNVL